MRGKLPPGEAGFNALYNKYMLRANRKNQVWKLSRRQFRKLTKGNCHYCGAKPAQVHGNKSEHGRYIYNGIDRVSSSLGYVNKNCVSCCWTCNSMKSDLTVPDLYRHIVKMLLQFHR